MQTNIHALRQRKIDVTKANQTLLDKAKLEGRELSAEEDKEFSQRMIELKKNDVAIAEKEAEMADERNMPATDYPNTVTAIALGAPGYDNGAAPARRGPGKVGAKYRDLFGSNLSNDGFASAEQFFAAVHNAHTQYHPNLRGAIFASSMNEAVPAQGGFLVPETWSAEMLDAAIEDSIVMSRARITPMTSDNHKLAGYDASDNSSSSPFGLQAAWVNELASNTPQTGKVRLIELHANKLALYVNASSELVADGMSFESQLGENIIRSASWSLDLAFLTGDGVGKPLGVLNSPSLISVAKETSQVIGTILYANVAKMYSRMHPSCISNAVWLINNTALPQLLQMSLIIKNVAGTENVGGGLVPIFTPDGRGGYTMLGRPVVLTEKLSAVGTKGDILFVDLSQYSVGLRRGLALERSIHAGWSTDSVGYRAITRVDGQSRWGQAFSPRAGSTLSWAIALADRTS